MTSTNVQHKSEFLFALLSPKCVFSDLPGYRCKVQSHDIN